MNTTNIEYCKNYDYATMRYNSRKISLKFIYITIYFCIYCIIINSKKIRSCFDSVKVEEIKEEEKKEEEKDVNTWYTINNGSARYKGEWKNGVPNGNGIKEIFAGEHKDSDGKPCDSDGNMCCHSIIDGTFVNGLAEGYGIQYYDQEDEETQPYYEGEFKNNFHHGQGAYYWGTGGYYKGSFKKCEFHGVGIKYNAKIGKTWIGEWENDKKIKGIWVDGELDSIYQDK